MKFWRRWRRDEPLPDTARVWNRACETDFQPTLAGDRMLKSAIQFDSLTCNGGLGHTLDVLAAQDVQDAVTSFRRLGLAQTAELVQDVVALSDDDAREALTDRYYELTEKALETAFERHYAEHPNEYEPVR